MNTLTNSPALPAGFLTALKSIFAAQDLLTVAEDCWVYGYDNSRKHVLPQAVVFPASHEQVLNTVQACNQFLIPLHSPRAWHWRDRPLKHGLVMSLERMDKPKN